MGLSDQSCPGMGEELSCSSNTTNILYASSPDGPWKQHNAAFVNHFLPYSVLRAANVGGTENIAPLTIRSIFSDGLAAKSKA